MKNTITLKGTMQLDLLIASLFDTIIVYYKPSYNIPLQ